MNEETLKCPYCEYNTTSDRKGKCLDSLLAHVKRAHAISQKELQSTGTIDSTYFDDKKVHDAEKHRNRLRDPQYIVKKNKTLRKKLGDTEFYKLPECKVCGFRGKQLYKHVFNIHNISVDEYKSKYDGITETKEYLNYLSESRKGENNPMFNNGKSELSPWSEEFYIKKGHSPTEAIRLKKEFIQRVSDNKSPESEPTRIEYYMKKYDIDEEAASDMLYKRQQTNTVESIASRNNISMNEAQQIRDNITTKWLNTLSKKSHKEMTEITRKKLNGSNSISTSSQSFFNQLSNYIPLSSSDILMGKNELILYTHNSDKRRYRAYDFTLISNKKIIEYNGDRTHANPKYYNPNDIPHKHMKRFNKEKTAQEIWDYDTHKIELAKQHGYEVYVVWHSDVKRNIYRELRKCKEFLEQ